MTQFVNGASKSLDATHAAPFRRLRKTLRLGTCLSGAAAALLILAPTDAHAAGDCGIPANGTVNCAVSDVGYPDGIFYSVNPAVREDLTVNVADGVAIDTGNSSNNGIQVANINGAVTINAAGTSITTSGVGAVGISGVTYVGDLTIHAGDIGTAGYQSSGIVASASQGDITVSAGTIKTSGDISYGISVLADAAGGGNVSIDVDSVSTAGLGSKGVGVFALVGDVALSAGSVATTGDFATAIQAVAGGDVAIQAGAVSTTGLYSHGVVGVTLGGALSVDAGSVSTQGNGSSGIYAVTVPVGGGDEYSFGTNEFVAAAGHDLIVNAGRVTTAGDNAPAIVAVNQIDGGNTIVTVGSVLTSGIFSKGVEAISVSGDATVIAGEVVTQGHFSGAIDVSAGGKATVTVGDVYTNGYGSTGVRATGGSAEVTLTGTITTGFDSSRAIIARAYGGDAAVHNLGSVVTFGYASNGIYAGATRDVSIDGGGTVETHGDRATGVVGFSSGGSVKIDTGTVTTTGDRAGGVYAGIRDIYGTGFSGDIAIDTGTVSTRGSGSQATGIFAVNYSNGGNITINAGGPVTTRLEGAGGITAIGLDGVTNINAGSVATRGSRADAILAYGGSVNIKATGAVSTLGDESNAIKAVGSFGDVTVSATDVTTAGDYSSGIQALARHNASVIAGAVTTQGDGAAGIVVSAGGADADYSVHQGSALVKATSVSTKGAGSSGIISSSFLGDNHIEVGSAATKGDYAYGVAGIARYGNLDIQAGTISTEGKLSDGIGFLAQDGALNISAGSISTKGEQSIGIRGFTVGHDSRITLTGGIETAGDRSIGIFATTTSNTLVIDNKGAIVTKGKAARGIRVNALNAHTEIHGGTIVTAGDEAIGIDVFAVGNARKSADVSAVSVTTSGARAHGIQIINPDDGFIGNGLPRVTAASVENDIRLTVQNVKVTGAGSAGILIDGVGKVTVDAGATTSAASTAINVKAREEALLTVRGATAGAGDAVLLSGRDVTLNVTATGSITGTNAVVLSAVGPYVPPTSDASTILALPGAPSATLTNSGTIRGGAGYAVLVNSGSANINNSGRIDGAIKLAQLDDTFNNTGTFGVSKDSDFGLGYDLFTNTGVVRLVSAAPANVSFLGLETFNNKDGLVDLTNGHGGDVLTLTGDYVGTGNARVSLDLKGTIADHLVIAGAATGKTKIDLHSLDGGNAVLTGGKPIALVKVGLGSSSDAFSLASSDVGFIRYGLDYDPGSRTFGLTGSAGSAVYRSLKLNEAASAAWHQSEDAVIAHLAGSRDSGTAGLPQSRKLWGEAAGQINRREESRAIGGAGGAVDLGYKQTFVGGQMGVDLGQRSKFRFGVTAGYLKSNLDYFGADEKSRFDVANVGAYATYKSGAFFANALVKYDRLRVSAKSDEAGYSEKIDGSGYGASIGGGARFGGAALFVEPSANLTWHKTDLEDLEALGQSVVFDDASGIRGKLGSKLGGSRQLGSGSILTVFAGGNLVHEFARGDGGTLVSGGTSEHVRNTSMETYGQGVLGVSVRSRRGITGFVEGNAAFGDAYKGTGGRVGLNIKL